MSVVMEVRCAPVSFQAHPTLNFVKLSCSYPLARRVRAEWHEVFGGTYIEDALCLPP